MEEEEEEEEEGEEEEEEEEEEGEEWRAGVRRVWVARRENKMAPQEPPPPQYWHSMHSMYVFIFNIPPNNQDQIHCIIVRV